MDLVVVVVLALGAAWLGYLLYLHQAARAAAGSPADALLAVLPSLTASDGRALVYCFSQHCPPCRRMSGEVERLAAEGLPIFGLDIGTQPTVVRSLGVRVTPTLIVVEHGVVEQMLLGARSADDMRRLLSG